ncbi:MAG: GNAT family N-acetyltransferase [Lachnospiraceae bacterium]|nr:GNAT family N-acetyltransferase [Lachnospiraceae bacterium]
MEIILLTEETKPYFLANLPESIKTESDIFIGAMDENEPVGLLAVRAEDKDFFINFIFVKENKRMAGAGRNMINLAKKIIFECGGDSVSITYVLSEETYGLHDFLEQVGLFEEQTKENMISYSIPLGDIKTQGRSNKENPTVHMLKDVPSSDWLHFMRDMDNYEKINQDVYIPRFREREYYDNRISHVFYSDGIIKGCFLCSIKDDEIVVEYIFMGKQSLHGMIDMVDSGVEAAKSLFKDDTIIRLVTASDSGINFVNTYGPKDIEPAGMPITQACFF